jgi:hypothetical protein
MRRKQLQNRKRLGDPSAHAVVHHDLDLLAVDRDFAFRRLAQDVRGLGIALGDQGSDGGDLVVVILRGELFHLGAVERPSTRR